MAVSSCNTLNICSFVSPLGCGVVLKSHPDNICTLLIAFALFFMVRWWEILQHPFSHQDPSWISLLVTALKVVSFTSEKMSQYRKIFSVWCFIPSFFYPDASFSFSNECRSQNRFSMKYILSDFWNTMSTAEDFFPKKFSTRNGTSASTCTATTAKMPHWGLAGLTSRNTECATILKVKYRQDLSCFYFANDPSYTGAE